MEYEGPGFIETDNSFDQAQNELATFNRGRQFMKVTGTIDEFFTVEVPVANAITHTCTIRNDEQCTVLKGCLGFDLDEELASFMKTIRPTEKQPLESYLPHTERQQILQDASLAKGYRLLAKSYQSIGLPSEAMRETYELFKEHCEADTRSLIEKAIACLDFGLYLRLLSGAMQRA